MYLWYKKLYMHDQCNFYDLLRDNDIRVTPLRIAVLETLRLAGKALTAPEIIRRVRKRLPIHKVTVYRILEGLIARGILRRISLNENAFRYELACVHNPPHPHFECSTCGEIQCLDPVDLSRIWVEVKGPLGNRADSIEIRVQGVCYRCK